MRSFIHLAGLLAFALGVEACAARIGHHWVVGFAPPPVRVVVTDARPGWLWIEGHWDWSGAEWMWIEGLWVESRPGFTWIQGSWVHVDGNYHWNPGHWRPDPGVRVREHR